MSKVDADFRFYSVREAAEELGMTEAGIRYMLRRGNLAGHKVGRHQWAISEDAIRTAKLRPRTTGRPRVGTPKP